MMKILSVTAAAAFLLAGCHSPEQFVTAAKTGNNVTTGEGTLYVIDGDKQVCNQSASQDPAGYPACMMFLNFQGRQYFKVDVAITPGMDSLTVYSQHDHIFVVDTGNTLRWAFARVTLSADPDDKIQDPEWSADGAYAVFLLGKTAVETWDGYAVKINNAKETFRFNTQGMTELSDPHLWVSALKEDSTVTGAGHPDNRFAPRDSAMKFFDSLNIKIVHVAYDAGAGARLLYLADYHRNQAYPDTFSLAKPASRTDWDVQNPIISPDGEWVAYTLVSSTGQDFEAYAQRLTAGSSPVFLAEGSDPHFWILNDGTSFILYSTRGGNAQEAYENIAPNSIGQTLLQQVRLRSTGFASLDFVKEGAPIVAAPYPMKGGITRNAGFVVTGYNRAYIWAVK